MPNARTTKPAAAKRTTAKRTPAKPAPTKAEQLKKDAEQERTGLTEAQKKKLAAQIIRLRESGTKWDGEGGVCEQVGIRTALVGRALMREFGAGDAIKPLTGSRAK
jgi:indole-3-glycerol phosphate synthase